MIPCRAFQGLLFVLLLIGATVTGNRVAAEDLQGTRQRLEAIANRLKAAEEAVLQNRESLHDVEADLEKLTQESRRIEARVTKLRKRLQEVETQVAALQENIAQLRREDRSRSEHLRERLVAMYKAGTSGALPLIFSAEPGADPLEDYLYFRRIAENDRALLEETRRRRERLERELDHLQRLRAEHKEGSAHLEAAQRELDYARKLKERSLAQLEGQGDTLASKVDRLREEEARLRRLVKKLESARSGEYTRNATGFDRQRGRLKPPVDARISVGYGVVRRPDDAVLVDSNGLEYAVESGQTIRAIWRGRVAFADSFRGFGNLMIIDHGDGYFSLYAHAEKLLRSAGAHVEPDEKIALSGERCYFEIRHRGAPVDPRPWLRSTPDE